MLLQNGVGKVHAPAEIYKGVGGVGSMNEARCELAECLVPVPSSDWMRAARPKLFSMYPFRSSCHEKLVVLSSYKGRAPPT